MKCHSELVESLGNITLPCRTVARWVGKFQQGRVSIRNEQRSTGQCADRLGACRHREAHGGRQTMDATGVREGKWHREMHHPQDIA
ncbi:hypothetical protein TNCV_5128631 [Trichonephila clavipes]|nr:hypothetical protein TNCV_5128631 [Trichonephila clavipes]